jgi:adenosylcobinamide-GDP ribazoletransferase
MKNILSFFSTIPLRGEISKARDEIWLLPLLGLIISMIPSVIFYFSPVLRGLLAVLTLYLIIGIIHLDGLADFFDGLLAGGGREGKIRVMKSPDIGVAGVFAVLMVLMIQILSLDSLPVKAFWIVPLAEVNSKMSMLFVLRKGDFMEGLGKFFSEAMDFRKFLLAGAVYALCLGIIFLIGGGFFTLFSVLCLITPLYISKLSVKNFGGLSGDCVGASAELTRTLTLLAGCLLWFSR